VKTTKYGNLVTTKKGKKRGKKRWGKGKYRRGIEEVRKEMGKIEIGGKHKRGSSVDRCVNIPWSAPEYIFRNNPTMVCICFI
jgi:hypothetical protein